MRVRFLGAHNTETAGTRLAGLLVDGKLALDAGSLTSSLTLAEQLGLTAVLVTHPHLDHIRDIPFIAMNCYLSEGSVQVYGSEATREALAAHILNGSIYSRFLEKPALKFHAVTPLTPFEVGCFQARPVPVNHSVPAVGYEIAGGGRRLFYTGDTGPGMKECWAHIRPDMLIIEVTSANRWTEFGQKSQHLSPTLLREELLGFRAALDYFPAVYTVHMHQPQEAEIRQELAELADELGCEITPAYEGLEVEV
jgi:ribonuclease BN (tRNA processing enzyme)